MATKRQGAPMVFDVTFTEATGAAIPIEETLSFVEVASESDVPIRNSSSLRYAVTAGLWEAGLNLDDWVDAAFASDATDANA